MKKICSAREAAQVLGISVRTAQLWVEEGRLQAWKTPGGHRRILVESVDRLRSQQMAMAGYANPQLSTLILDSDPIRCEELGAYLRSAIPDTQVDTVRDAVSVVLRIGSNNPDVLIVDLEAAPIESLLAILTHPQLQHQNRLSIVIAGDAETASRICPEILANTTLLLRQSPPFELVRLVDAFLRGCRHREQIA